MQPTSGILALMTAVSVATPFDAVTGAGAGYEAPTPNRTQSCWVDVTTTRSLCVDRPEDLVAALAEETGIRLVGADPAPGATIPVSVQPSRFHARAGWD